MVLSRGWRGNWPELPIFVEKLYVARIRYTPVRNQCNSSMKLKAVHWWSQALCVCFCDPETIAFRWYDWRWFNYFSRVSFPFVFLVVREELPELPLCSVRVRWGPLGSVGVRWGTLGVISRIHFGSFRFISVSFRFISVSFRFISVISRSQSKK